MNKTVIYRGPGFCTLLGLTFIILKLTGVITWPWLWILSPIWIPLVLAFVFITFILLLTLFCIFKNVS